MNTIFDGPDEIDEEYQEILSAIEPDMGDECVHGPDPDVRVFPAGSGSPPMVCKRCGALTPAINPDSHRNGTHCQHCTDYLIKKRQEQAVREDRLSLDQTESFTAWLDAQGDQLAMPASFTEWLERNGDAI